MSFQIFNSIASSITQTVLNAIPDQPQTLVNGEGSTESPSIAFQGETNTGIYRSNNGDASKMVLSTTGSDILELYGSGEITTSHAVLLQPLSQPNQVMVVKIPGGAAQTLTNNTFTTVTNLTTEVINGFIEEESGRFKLPANNPEYSGYYLCTANVLFQPNVDGARTGFFEVFTPPAQGVNFSTSISYGISEVAAAQVGLTSFSMSTIAKINAGDDISVKVSQTSGNDLLLFSSSSSIAIVRIL